ncbi:14613_t:CDS:1, partial [Cetraspora pellucida]
DQARLHITKDRQNKIALINNKPISYQEIGSDTGYRCNNLARDGPAHLTLRNQPLLYLSKYLSKRDTPLKVRKNIAMAPNVFGNQRIHTPVNQANIIDGTPTNEQRLPTLHLMTNNKAKQNDKQSKNAEEKMK